MDVPRRMKPPGGVVFASWMIGIGAFFLCLLGALFLFVHFDAATLEKLGTTEGAFRVVGFVMLAIGLLEFLLIYALRDGSNGARIITTVFIGLGALISLMQVLSRSPAGVIAWIQLLVDTVILVGLWGTPSATEFFRRPVGQAVAAPPPPPTAAGL